MTDAIVIIPTYNEIENIEAIIRAVFSQKKPFDILVVDDNSPDGTSKKVKLLRQSGYPSGNPYPDIRISAQLLECSRK